MHKLSLPGVLLTGLLAACAHPQTAGVAPAPEDGMLRDWSRASASAKAQTASASPVAASSSAQDLSAAEDSDEVVARDDGQAGSAVTPVAPQGPLTREAIAQRRSEEDPGEVSGAEVSTAEAPNAGNAGSRSATLAVRVRANGKANKCSVTVGTRKLGRAPIASATVPAGKHRVQVICADKRQFVDTITLTPGEHEQLVVKSADLQRRGQKRQARR